jgi:hypothetical protein
MAVRVYLTVDPVHARIQQGVHTDETHSLVVIRLRALSIRPSGLQREYFEPSPAARQFCCFRHDDRHAACGGDDTFL